MVYASANNDLNIKRYYICYIDVLGYKQLLHERGEMSFLKTIDKVFNQINELFISGSGSFRDNCYIKVFSDNIVIAIDYSLGMNELIVFSSYIAIFQRVLLLEHNIFIRGAITEGNLYINEKYVYGSGLIRAHELESEIAIYPRIILDTKSNIEATPPFETDFDGLSFINYLLPELLISVASYESAMSLHKKAIEAGLKKYKQDRIIQKYMWCKLLHNDMLKRCKSLDSFTD
jgi:hypothetical protein